MFLRTLSLALLTSAILITSLAASHNRVNISDFSIKQERHGQNYKTIKFYDKHDNLAAIARYELEKHPKQHIYLHLLKVEADYRSSGLGSQVFKRVMTDIVALYPAIKQVKWWACPFDPPSGIEQSEMRGRLYNFYRRQGAKVDSNGNARLNLVKAGYKK